MLLNYFFFPQNAFFFPIIFVSSQAMHQSVNTHFRRIKLKKWNLRIRIKLTPWQWKSIDVSKGCTYSDSAHILQIRNNIWLRAVWFLACIEPTNRYTYNSETLSSCNAIIIGNPLTQYNGSCLQLR